MPFYSKLVVFLTALCASRIAEGQASAQYDDWILNVVIRDGLEVDVFPDAVREGVWYYSLASPRIAERSIGGKNEPCLHLYRYQLYDEINSDIIKNGGLLQFSTSNSLTTAELDILREKLKSTKSGQFERFLQLPLSASKVFFLNAHRATGLSIVDQLCEEEPPKSSPLTYSLKLSSSGTEIFDALLSSQNGLPIKFEICFEAVVGRGSGEVEIDLANARHALRDARFREMVVGLAHGTQTDTYAFIEVIAREKITSIRSGSRSLLDDYPMIWARILAEKLLMLETKADFESIDKFTNIQNLNYVFGPDDNLSKVRITLSSGDTVKCYLHRSMTISFQKYGDPKTRLISNLDDEFSFAYMALPSDPGELYSGIHLEIAPKIAGRRLDTVRIDWNAAQDWVSQGKQAKLVCFPLKNMLTGTIEAKDCKFEVRARAETVFGQVLDDRWQLGFFAGVRGLFADFDITSGREVAIVDFSQIPWILEAGTNRDEGVVSIDIKFTSGEQVFKTSVFPNRSNGVYTSPKPLHFLLDRNNSNNNEAVFLSLTFKSRNNVKEWKYSGQNIRNSVANLYLIPKFE